MKVIGAGFGRTGTKSLQLALEILGFGKCCHMEELLRNPAGVLQWKQAYNEEEVDWNKLFKNYESIVDFPDSMYYKELSNFYPGAKVILTVRDAEKWYKSVNSTIFSFDPGIGIKLKMLFQMPFSATARNLFQVISLNQKSIWKKYFEGKFKDKKYSIQKFEKHIKEVQDTIPHENLLIFEAKDGWGPLCNFLNVDIPAEPYPRSNSREDFHEWATGVVREVLQ